MNISKKISLASKPSTIKEATELTTPKDFKLSDGIGTPGKPNYESIDMEFMINLDAQKTQPTILNPSEPK